MTSQYPLNASVKPVDTTEAQEFLRRLGVPFVKLEDGRLDVRGNLDISRKGLRRLPDLSNVIVRWDFDCSNNPLENLMGAPSYIGKNCDVSNCGLKTLEGTLHTVGERFDCSNNQLSDLIGGPRKVGGQYWASYNLLTTFYGLPEGYSQYILSDIYTGSANSIPRNLRQQPDLRQIAPVPLAPVVPELPSRQSFLSDKMNQVAAPPVRQPQTLTFVQPAKPSHVNKVMTVEDLLDRKMYTIFDFDRLERISIIRKDENAPIEAMDRDPFSILQSDPLLRRAFKAYKERGGTKTEEDIFPGRTPVDIKRGVIRNDRPIG
jgi:hypothetical protein